MWWRGGGSGGGGGGVPGARGVALEDQVGGFFRVLDVVKKRYPERERIV